ncbi:MAG: glycosyltransferase [Tannerellaceae bacterium]|nr:glycosyltransferase [Tannerellaceae bacterium]
MFNLYFSINTFDIILIGILITLFLILTGLTVGFYMRPVRIYRKKENSGLITQDVPPVSVIVYAKNESVNLQKHLPFLLHQQYPTYEVIVINDGSTDESEDVLSLLESQYQNLYHTFIPQESRYLSRKKLALTVGIKAAKHDILMFIEANCKPISPNWLIQMVQPYLRKGKETEIVLGFCAYRKATGLFHKLVSYDNLLTGMQYLSAALGGHPFKGNGRNLSYRKDLFFKNKGFSSSLKLHAGDDDLFINTYAKGSNTQVEYAPESVTEMEVIDRFAVWQEMKVSRAATQHHYRSGSLFLYRFEAFLYFLFIVSTLFALSMAITGNFLLPVVSLGVYVVYYLVKGIVFNKSAKLLQQKKMGFSLPLLDILLYSFNVYVRIYRLFRGKNDYTFRVSGKKR